MSAPLGLIAGSGELPVVLVREAKLAGRKVVVVIFDDKYADALSSEADNVSLLGLGQAGKVIKTFQDAGVEEIVLAGKVDKRVIFKNMKFDFKALSILNGLRQRNDDTFMLGIVDALEKDGLKVVSQADILRSLMPESGKLAKRALSEQEKKDIEFGMDMAKGIAALDIGQTVVVKDGAVLAAEAIEGTDEAIERGSGIAGKGAVVCKVSKPDQDPRFDVPTVGVETIKKMVECNAGALAIEAGETVVVNLEAMLKLCDRHKIAFVAL